MSGHIAKPDSALAARDNDRTTAAARCVFTPCAIRRAANAAKQEIAGGETAA